MTDPNILFHFKPADDLFRTPLQAEQRFDLLPDLTAEGGIAPCCTPRPSAWFMGLLGPVTAQTLIPVQLSTDGGFVTFQQFDNPCLTIIVFLQDVNWYCSSRVSCV